MKDTPVEQRRKELPQGEANWEGFNEVWSNLQEACMTMAKSQLLSDIHIETMAIMGTGHEETMKGQQLLLREYGWIK